MPRARATKPGGRLVFRRLHEACVVARLEIPTAMEREDSRDLVSEEFLRQELFIVATRRSDPELHGVGHKVFIIQM